MKKLIVEFIGTFFLVLTVGMTAAHTPAGVIPPLAIGCALMIMVYAGGYISGGHYNPAVTLAVLLRGKITLRESVGYWISQIIAAFAAASVVLYLKGSGVIPPSTVDMGRVFLAEFLFTFALAWVVLNTATADGTKGNSYYGLAIGFTVVVGAFAMGAVSGAAFNPAVVTGAAVVGLIAVKNVWIYVLANLAGGAAAAAVFRVVSAKVKV
jgi:aquaporin Z